LVKQETWSASSSSWVKVDDQNPRWSILPLMSVFVTRESAYHYYCCWCSHEHTRLQKW
jgi:hypothetical protein